MRECLALGQTERSEVGNGAMVGAILVRENKILERGSHRGFGHSHAEADLLARFSGEIHPEDILYVNLEPCCHQGKTPPCSRAIIGRGVKRVCFGMEDPDPRVRGQGIEELRRAGIEVIGPVARASCEFLNRGFINQRTKGRPWITLKRAQTRDGRIANEDGSPLKITSPSQDAWAHTFLRAEHDAVLVGVETVVRDNPKLNARLAASGSGFQPWRITLDPRLRTPVTAKVVSDEVRGRTIIITAQDHGRADVQAALQGRGVRILTVPLKDRKYDLSELWKVLSSSHDGFHGLTSILVEGGMRTWEAFREAGAVDEEAVLTGA